MIFLDTSAIYALADSRDPNHERASELIRQVSVNQEELLVHNYVLVEAAALLQNRLGLEATLRFLQQAEHFHIHWITSEDHASAVTLLEQRGRRGLSLVDCMSFHVMRQFRLQEFLAFDSDFEREGFNLYTDGTEP